MILCILGRQPELGQAELASLYGSAAMFGQEAAIINSSDFDIQSVGGTQKAGRIIQEFPHTDWAKLRQFIMNDYITSWHAQDHKITLGISVHGRTRLQSRDINKLGLAIKQTVKAAGGSIRLIPTNTVTLNTAVSHHNKLGLSPNKIELLIVQAEGKTILAQSTGAQNITALARRDQGRPKRDAFVGMLPPKLALMMVNMATGPIKKPATILDPFCGTGVILQESLLRGHTVYGSDLSDKMIDYTQENLAWFLQSHPQAKGRVATVCQGDATSFTWPTAATLDAIACETYLGQPFSATPSPAKLREVRGNCNFIISKFLQNIGTQITTGTPLCVAVPAWRDLKTGRVSRLALVDTLARYGFTHKNTRPLLYFREDQVVARDILLLEKM